MILIFVFLFLGAGTGDSIIQLAKDRMSGSLRLTAKVKRPSAIVATIDAEENKHPETDR